MLLKRASRKKLELPIVPVEPLQMTPLQAVDDDAAREAELRRQMYERIAQGNALAEVEENARRIWRGD